MTRKEAIAIIRKEYLCVDRDCDIERNCGKCDLMMPSKEPILEAYKVAIKTLEQLTSYEQTINKLTKAISEQEPCDDAISREAVQDYIAKYLSQYLYNDVREAVEVIDEYIGELPPVKPQQKTGHWRHYESMLICSECGTEFYDDIMEYCGDDVPKCCPNCGAKMESEVEE